MNCRVCDTPVAPGVRYCEKHATAPRTPATRDTIMVHVVRAQVLQVLAALGRHDATMTDVTRVGDLGLDAATLAAAAVSLGVPVTAMDYVWQVAVRLFRANPPQLEEA